MQKLTRNRITDLDTNKMSDKTVYKDSFVEQAKFTGFLPTTQPEILKQAFNAVQMDVTELIMNSVPVELLIGIDYNELKELILKGTFI